MASGVVPQTMERQLGESVLGELEPAMLVPSRLPPSDQLRVRHLLEQLQAQGASDRTLRLHIRASDSLGANAFCLPGGILLVTDELARLASDDELLAVLAHEAGHDRHRHPLQKAVHLRALSVLSGLFGGGDAPLQSVGEVLVGSAYSRGFELEADREASAILRRLNRPTGALLSILDKLERTRPANGIPSFLLTHPSTQERRQQLLISPP